MADTTEYAVIASFDGKAQAEQAVHDLMDWDKANEEIKLGAIGLLTREGGTWGQGEIKTKNFSSRQTGKGAKIGMGLGVLAAVFSGGLTLIPAAIGGAITGGAVGSLSRQGLGLSDEELQQLRGELDGGRAAILVMCNENEVQATTDYLVAKGGKLQPSRSRGGPPERSTGGRYGHLRTSRLIQNAEPRHPIHKRGVSLRCMRQFSLQCVVDSPCTGPMIDCKVLVTERRIDVGLTDRATRVHSCRRRISVVLARSSPAARVASDATSNSPSTAVVDSPVIGSSYAIARISRRSWHHLPRPPALDFNDE